MARKYGGNGDVGFPGRQEQKNVSNGNVLFYLIIGSIFVSLLFLLGIICLSLFWDGWKEYYHAYDFYVSTKGFVPEEERYAISPIVLRDKWIPAVSGFVFPLFFTLLIEVPYVYRILKYKSIKNIVCVNALTNVILSFVVHFFMFLYSYFSGNVIYVEIAIAVFIVFEFWLIPWIETRFYVITGCVVPENCVITHVYIVNMLSLFVGTILVFVTTWGILWICDISGKF